MTFVTTLSAVTRDDIRIAGGKGANLGELVRAGFPVPAGFVVTTEAYAAFTTGFADQLGELAAVGDAAGIRALFERGVPVGIAGMIEAEYARLGGPGVPVAVRSSATAEDLAEASFAGQQDTYLGITGPEAVVDAVRRCWASLWTDRAMAYRDRAGLDMSELSLAVVVQRLVDPEVAGILFTANPANGRRNETVLNAAYGLGEAIVGGEVTPDELVVADRRVTSRRTAKKTVRTIRDEMGTHTEPVPARLADAATLSDAEAIALADLGRRIEAHFGAPQDIEWVLAPDGIWIVQSRPITALPEPVGPTPDDWSVPRSDGMYMRASIVEQLPDPLSPLFADLIRPAVADSLATVLTRYFGKRLLQAGDMDFPTVNGYAYYFYSNAGMRRLCAAAPAGMLRAYGGGSRVNGITMWRDQGHPDYVRVVAEWAAREPAAMSARQLLEGASALIAAGAAYYTFVQAVIPQSAMAEIAFTRLYRTLVRDPDAPPALAYLLGFDSQPIRAERSLFAVATWCRETPGVAAALEAGEEIPEAYAEEFRARLDAHLALFGHSTYNLDVMQPVAADDPAPVLAALRHAVSGRAGDPDARVERLARERQAAERWLEDHVDPVRRVVLMKTLASAQRLVPLREDALADVGLGWPAARRFLRELGRRLVEAGLIEAADDVFWLTGPEASAAARDLSPLAERPSPLAEEKSFSLAEEGPSPLAEEPAKRASRSHSSSTLAEEESAPLAEEESFSLAEEESFSLAEEPAKRASRSHSSPTLAEEESFSLAEEPAERASRSHATAVAARRATWRGQRLANPPGWLPAGGFWYRLFRRFMPSNEAVQTGPELRGLGASGGRVSGAARLLNGPEDFGAMQPGEILVAPITTPAYTPFFAMAGGVVTDIGGPLSHSSIVAREYGIPAVLGTGSATRRIRDGDLITVDGDRGVVILATAG